MVRMRRFVPGGLILALICLDADRARAQGPTIEATEPEAPGAEGSLLGETPGSGASSALGEIPGQNEGIISGRPGPSVPRVSPSVSQPGPGIGLPVPGVITAPAIVPANELPLYGPLELPASGGEEGPPDGLTLDMAIERLLQANMDLRSRFLEIPQARADILTASLRANPVFYADAQLVPYGGYPANRPGGPTQYDVNLSYPLDVTRKRQARTLVACQVHRVIEAQYQDAVRLQIDNLYTAFVDVLAARDTVRYARTSLAGLERVLEVARTHQESQYSTQAEFNRVKILRDAAEIGVSESEVALRDARRTLAVLLGIRPGQADALELRGAIRDRTPLPVPEEQLIEMALALRPDLVAFRLGVGRAQAEVKLAHANRLQDVYLLYQPYTLQDNPRPFRDATSWAVGVTVPLPVYNRNQGNIQRARINVVQTQNELAALEQQVIAEVQRAVQQYERTQASLERIERDLLPSSRQILDTALNLYRSGEKDVVFYLNAQREHNDIIRQYRDTAVRHRRSMLNLNTTVAQRISP